MNKQFWGWMLIIVGAVGLVMSIISIIAYGVHNLTDVQTIAAYGLLGLAMFSTGQEFRKMAT